MDNIYNKIWKLAKPYYEKGRIYDIPHIEWMMKQIERICKIENLNERLLMPIGILHDVGYSEQTNNNPNIKCQNSKKAHMVAGAKIARKILEKVNYDPTLIEKIVHYISFHDNWVFGDNTPFKECKEMGVFNDLDFLWGQSSYEMLKRQGESIGKTPAEMYNFWMNDEKLINRPFLCEFTKKMFKEFMDKRKEEIGGKN